MLDAGWLMVDGCLYFLEQFEQRETMGLLTQQIEKQYSVPAKEYSVRCFQEAMPAPISGLAIGSDPGPTWRARLRSRRHPQITVTLLFPSDMQEKEFDCRDCQ